MKQVTFEKKETVNFEELNDESIVGYIYMGVKRILIQTEKGFSALKGDDFNNRGFWSRDSLKKYVEKYNEDNPTTKFFLFENTKEAFKWMGE